MAEHYTELVRRTGVDGRDLASTYVLHPPHDRIVPNFGVTEFTEFTKGILEYSGEDGEDGVD